MKPGIALSLLLTGVGSTLMAAGTGAISPASTDPLHQSWGHFFRCERAAGRVTLGDAESHFNGEKNVGKLTYDVSNNAMLAIHGHDGVLKAVTAYRDTYLALTTDWPGVWTCKDNSTHGPYSFSLELDGTTYDLAKVNWDLRTGLLDNTIPVTEFTGPGKRFIARVVTFAPISVDGSQRLRGVVYGLQFENCSSAPLKATVVVPRQPGKNKPYDTWAQSDNFGAFDMALGDAPAFKERVPVELAAGASIWVPVILAAPGEGVAEAVNARGTLAWLADTQRYYRSLLGRLSTPDQPWLGEFYERMLLQAFQSIGQAGSGRIAGSNWGSVPATRMIWTKDFYYSALPLMATDPVFAEKLVTWFDLYGVRPSGNQVRSGQRPAPGVLCGGVGHSISLAVAAPLLAGVLYDRTGDAALLRHHPEWKAHWGQILDAILATRVTPDTWLFPTRFISDGPVKGDLHTGSNICVWRALVAYARMLDEAWQDPAAAAIYRAAAAKVKASLLARTVIDTPQGKAFIEAINYDGKVTRMESDGEESDTTLAPFYGLLPADNPLYLATMRFAMSTDNVSYCPALHAISWEIDVPSTSPGYNKGLGAAVDTAGLFGEHGAYTEMRRLTDGDGSIWWWSYGQKQPQYGSPIRAYSEIGKAGWTAGVHSALFPSRFLGLAYDAPTATLTFAPLPAIGAVEWRDLPMGNARFTVACAYQTKTTSATVANPNAHPVRVVVSVPVPQGGGAVATVVDGVPVNDAVIGVRLGQKMATVTRNIPAKGSVIVTVSVNP